MKKKFLLSAAFAAFVLFGLAQVPEAFNYQAVIRDGSGEILANQNVSFRISILQGSESGAVLYSETHTVSTNAFGLVNLTIGNGTVVSGTFSPTGWGTASHFLKVEIDPSGGSTFTHLGTSELLSVPYAFHAQTVQSDMVDDADADPSNEIQTLSLVGSDLTLSDGGGTVTLPSGGAGDDWGAQVVESDATLSGDGTSGDPLGVVGDLTDDQNLTLVGNDLSITDGNTVTIPGDDWGTQTAATDATLSGNGTSGDPLGVVGDLTDDQNLTLVGNDLSITDGNTVTIPGDDWGTQVVESNATLTGNGTGSSPLGVVGDLTDDQTLSLVGDNLSISNGNSVNIGGADNQTLSVAGFDLTISNGNTVPVPSIWSLNGNRAYYSDGAVGIGTSTPIRNFNVVGGETSFMSFNDSHSGASATDGLLVGIQTAGNDAYVYNYENGQLRLGAGGGTRLAINNNGNVGIGTITPVRLLDLRTTGGTSSFMNFHTDGTGGTTGDGFLLGVNGASQEAVVWNYENTDLYFATNGSTRMIIEAGGNVGIGTTLPTHTLSVYGTASKTGGGVWSVFSDSRLKDIQGDYRKGLSEILALQPVIFNYKVDNPLDLPSDVQEIGLVAQEVRKIFPEAVTLNQNGYFDFNMHPINVAFINAIKELKAENNNLKDKVNELESRLAQIEKMLHE